MAWENGIILPMTPIIGFKIYGSGPLSVIVLHDWYCDHTSWDSILPYLSTAEFTYIFADLRGYGKSKGIAGQYNLEEASGDVIALIDHLKLDKVSLIGHSMSAMVVQRIAQIIPSRLESIIAVTPVAPIGLRCDEAMADIFRGLALADDEQRLKTMTTFWGERLSLNWIKFKLRSWRETASAEAAAKYVDMWGCTDISEGAKNIDVPMLIIACLEDSLPFIPDSLEKTMLPFYSKARMQTIIEAGHYPMQEQPPMMATIIERFLIDKK